MEHALNPICARSTRPTGEPRLLPSGAPSASLAALLFVLVSLVLFSPLYPTFENWGDHDWDQHCFYNEVARKSVLGYGQFPLWNPYHCGGTVALAEPQSACLSIAFPLVLAFGTVAGLKLSLVAHTALGLFGMFLLAGHFNLSGWTRGFPPLVFFLSSWYPLHLATGHTIYVTYAFLPYVFLFYLKGQDTAAYAVLAGAGLALAILGGGVYTVYHTLLLLGLHCLLSLLTGRRRSAVLSLAVTLVSAFCFSAVKTLPMLEYLSVVRQAVPGDQYTTWRLLFLALFARHQAGLYLDGSGLLPEPMDALDARLGAIQGTAPWAWHEYGAYVGPVPVALALASLVRWRQHWPLIACALFFLALSLGRAFPGAPWNLLHSVPVFDQLHGPSRFIIPFVMLVSLLGGATLSQFGNWLATRAGGRWKSVGNGSVLAILGLVSLDQMAVSMRVLALDFTRKPAVVRELPFRQILVPSPSADQFAAVLMNCGVVNGYTRTSPFIAAVPMLGREGKPNPNYKGEAYLAETGEPASIVYFSPNRIRVALPYGTRGTLVLNQNFLKGWRASGKQVRAYHGLVCADVGPDDRQVEFRYVPWTFLVGLVVTGTAWPAGMVLWRRRDRHQVAALSGTPSKALTIRQG